MYTKQWAAQADKIRKGTEVKLERNYDGREENVSTSRITRDGFAQLNINEKATEVRNLG